MGREDWEGQGGRGKSGCDPCPTLQLSGAGRKRLRVRAFRGIPLVDVREYFDPGSR
jgi:Transcriptional Coactivator p15 (PC4)